MALDGRKDAEAVRSFGAKYIEAYEAPILAEVAKLSYNLSPETIVYGPNKQKTIFPVDTSRSRMTQDPSKLQADSTDGVQQVPCENAHVCS